VTDPPPALAEADSPDPFVELSACPGTFTTSWPPAKPTPERLGPTAKPTKTPNASVIAASAPAERGAGTRMGSAFVGAAGFGGGGLPGTASGPTRVPHSRQ
jgi:hypothetical protein